MKAKILAFGLIAILIFGAFKLKVVATEHFLKAKETKAQQQVIRDCSDLPAVLSEDIKDCEESVRNNGSKQE